MNRDRWIQRAAPGLLALLALLAPAPYLAAQDNPSGQATLNFLFAAGAQLAQHRDAPPAPLETRSVLSSGDRIKFFLEPASDGCFYLFHVSPAGDLSLLFPADVNASQTPAGRQVFVPEGPLWFELDAAPGTEKIYFLASASPLRELEALFARHATLKDRADIRASVQAILDEVSRLNQKRRPLAAPAEKPVRIAGKFRAPSKTDSAALPDITPFAVEIEAQGYFSRTFTIEHR
jgi:hypothetical protein